MYRKGIDLVAPVVKVISWWGGGKGGSFAHGVVLRGVSEGEKRELAAEAEFGVC